MTDVLIANIQKNSREVVRVKLGESPCGQLVILRVYYRAASGDMAPSTSGFALDVAKLPELADAVSLALEKVRQRGLVK